MVLVLKNNTKPASLCEWAIAIMQHVAGEGWSVSISKCVQKYIWKCFHLYLQDRDDVIFMNMQPDLSVDLLVSNMLNISYEMVARDQLLHVCRK